MLQLSVAYYDQANGIHREEDHFVVASQSVRQKDVEVIAVQIRIVLSAIFIGCFLGFSLYVYA